MHNLKSNLTENKLPKELGYGRDPCFIYPLEKAFIHDISPA